jgi:uncharacterized coiled-coil protein SlyX
MGEIRPLSQEKVGAVQFLWTLRQLLEENPKLELERPTGEVIKTTPREVVAQMLAGVGIGSGGGPTISGDLEKRLASLEKQIKSQDEEIGGINEALDALEGKKSTKKQTAPATTESTESRPKPPV